MLIPDAPFRHFFSQFFYLLFPTNFQIFKFFLIWDLEQEEEVEGPYQ